MEKNTPVYAQLINHQFHSFQIGIANNSNWFNYDRKRVSGMKNTTQYSVSFYVDGIHDTFFPAVSAVAYYAVGNLQLLYSAGVLFDEIYNFMR